MAGTRTFDPFKKQEQLGLGAAPSQGAFPAASETPPTAPAAAPAGPALTFDPAQQANLNVTSPEMSPGDRAAAPALGFQGDAAVFGDANREEKGERAQQAKENAADQANPYENQAADAWAGLMSGYDDSLGSKINMTYADEARAGRAADVQSVMLGQGVSGGGYQAGQAQVALGGMAQRQDVANKHYQQGLNMKMAYLETLIKRAEATKDRALQERLQAEADKTLLLINSQGIDASSYGQNMTIDQDGDVSPAAPPGSTQTEGDVNRMWDAVTGEDKKDAYNWARRKSFGG